MLRLTDIALTGIESRIVEVHDHIDRVKGVCQTIRSDTGEVVETRHLTPREQQLDFDELTRN